MSGSVRRLLTLGLCVAGIAASPRAHHQGSSQSGSPPAPQAVIQLAGATTVAEREALVAATPALSDPSQRKALEEHAQLLLRQRNFPAALRALASLEWLAARANDDVARLSALLGMGSATGQSGDLAASLGHHENARVVAARLGDPASMQPVVSGLAIIQRRFGDIDSALALNQEALDLAHEAKRPDQTSRVLNNLGVIYMGQGNAALAQDYFRRSLELKVDDGGRGTVDIANTHNNLGALYEEIGDVPQALVHFERALGFFEKIGAASGAVSVLSNIGHAHSSLGDPKTARQYYDRALAAAEQSKDRIGLATVLSNIGNLSRDSGRLEEATDYQRRSLALREEIGDAIGLTEGNANLADLLIRMDRPAEAEPYITRAMTVADQASLLNQLVRAQVFEGRMLEALGRDHDAVAAYERAILSVERLREQTPGGEPIRQIFLSQRLTPYLAIASLHASAARGFDALVAVERARARTLLDLLSRSRSSRGLAADVRTRERQVNNRVTAAAVRLASNRQRREGASTVEAVEAELRDARVARDRFYDELYAAHPDLRLQRGDADILTRGRLARLVSPESAVVVLVIARDSAWALLVTSGDAGPDITSHKLAISAADLQARGARFVEQVAGRDLSFAGTARQLYADVFGPLDHALTNVRRVTIVPDAELWRVPFHALMTPRGRFLIEERSVAYAPSLSAMSALQERHERRGVTPPFLLALGDPASPTVAVSDGRRSEQGRLPEAAREVKELARLYGADRSAVYVDAAATESIVRQRIGEASVLHLATHGVLDDRAPLDSHVTLAPEASASTSTTDGRLKALEFLELDLRADLVVLSACETARGTVGGGEGIVGFAWSVLAAGASSTVLSQWEVDSASTTQLMIEFHRQLRTRASMTPADALRGASQALLKESRYRHPFYWAGFVVLGR